MTFGQKLRELRRNNNLTQSELGEKLGVGKTTVSMYETDNSTPNDVIKKKIANLFNVTIDYLLDNVKEDDYYYHDPEVRKLADELKNDPNYRVLFDASRNLKKEDVKFVKNMIDELKKKDPYYNEDDEPYSSDDDFYED